MKYLRNLFVCIVPVLIWNAVFLNKLPEVYLTDFWKDIPPLVAFGENIFRSIVILLPLLMPLTINSPRQMYGLAIYITGILIYASSWLMQIYFPMSQWSQSLWGFLAPSYTPFIWLFGIGRMSKSLYIPSPYKPWHYYLVSLLFLIFHNAHAYLIYLRR